MAHRRLLTLCLVVALFSLGTAAWPGLAAVAQAQCGEPPKSSCMTCHAAEYPVATRGEWHEIHAAKDACTGCHGGNASAADKTSAHQTMTAQPLADIYTDCHACHPDDYISRADRFAGDLGVTPGSCPTPTAAPDRDATTIPMLMPPSPAAPTAPAASPWPLLLGTLGVAGLFGLGLLALARRQLAHS